MQPSEEIKSRLDVADVIRDYIQLQQAGANFKARCPFHREKTPSFMVSPEKQIWHCFGCGKGGDIFSFVQEIEGISFVEALRLLAPKAGVTLTKQDPKISSQRNRLLDIVELSRKYYHKVLLESSVAESARNYLKERGLTEETIEEWQIGFSPDSWDDLIKLLQSRGYKENEIFLAGMSIKKEGTNRFYNRFRGRIMFPINDVNCNTVAFTARVSPEKEKDEKQGKYINSPQTSIYDKSNILFGLDKAKMNIKKSDLTIVVEGQMDVITAHQNGFKDVVASSGTALTPFQINLAKRFSNNIALAFDMDEAGSTAADRGIREAMKAEMNIKVIELPEGKDPDDCIKSSPENWKEAVRGAKPMMQYYFDKVFGELDVSNIEDINTAKNKLFPIISILENKIEQDYWISKFSQMTGRNESSVREVLAKMLSGGQKKTYNQNEDEKNKTPQKTNIIKPREELLSELLLSLLIKYPVFIEYSANNVEIEQLVGEMNQNVYKKLILFYNNNINNIAEFENSLDINFFNRWISQNQVEKKQESQEDQLMLNKLVLLVDKEYGEIDMISAKNEVIKIISELKKKYLTNRMKEIERNIVNLENSGDDKAQEEISGLMEEMKLLSDKFSKLNSA